MIFIISLIFLLILGLGFYFKPELFVKAEERDNPEAIENIKKGSGAFIGFAVFAAYLAMKYSTR